MEEGGDSFSNVYFNKDHIEVMGSLEKEELIRGDMYMGVRYVFPSLKLDELNGIRIKMNTRGHKIKVTMNVKNDLIFQLDSYAYIAHSEDSVNVYELPFQNLLIDNIDRQ